MKRTIAILFGLCILTACQQGHQALIGAKVMDATIPPNMVKIGENLYADRTELSNISWLEYLYWQMKVHGPDSGEYLATLPDSSVWSREYSFGEPFVEHYLRHPAYHQYPVVGISYQQATAYCQWRTDRVAEMMLIQKGFLDASVPAIGRKPVFTLERYRQGEYGEPLGDLSIPIFRLPTEQEWQRLASGGLDAQWYPHGVDVSRLSRKEIKKSKGAMIFHVKHENPSPNHSFPDTSPIRTNSPLPNAFGVHHAIGNVAEMTSREGIAKGGGFMHTLEECAILEQQTYMFPEYWLGFRCVARQGVIRLTTPVD